MRVRKLATGNKTMATDTGWKTGPIPPRESMIFPKTKPMGSGWKWRSCKAASEDDCDYVLLAQCHPGKDNWKAWLMIARENGSSVVARFEYHGTHPGLHIHAHCDRSGIEVGGSSIDNLARIPNSNDKHRRVHSWTETGFWEAAKAFFRVSEKKGSLL